jgi:hypothetical protein
VAFTVNDFRDLIDLLEQHPEWRAELRRYVLSEEILELPSLVRQLVESQALTEARVRELTEAQVRAEARLTGVEDRLERVEDRLERVEDRLERVEDRLERVETTLAHHTNQLGTLQGDALEIRYERQAPSYFGSIVGRLRVMQKVRLADLLDDAIDEGHLSQDERGAIMLVDLVMTGRRRTDGQDVYLLAEISVGVGPHDVERAAERAELLAKLGKPVIPFVAGDSINEAAAALAHERGVWYAQSGKLTPP